MTEKSPRVNLDSSLVLAEEDQTVHQQMIDDLEMYTGFLTPDNRIDRIKLLRHEFEKKYSEELDHMRRSLLPYPCKTDDPEGYRAWKESQHYVEELAIADLRCAFIVRRLATSVQDKVTANRPTPEPRTNKHGVDVDDNGRNTYLIEEDEFGDLKREGEAWAGVAIPLNGFEIRDVISLQEEFVSASERNLYVYADLQFSERDGGEVYNARGESFVIEPNPEHQEQYGAVEAEVKQETNDIRSKMGRYVALLPLDERELLIKKHRLKAE